MQNDYKELLRKMREKHLKKRKPKDKNKPIAVWMQDDIYRDFSVVFTSLFASD